MALESDGEHYTDAMVDIETTSTEASRGAILQIAAVKFNAKTRKVSPNFFCKSLTIPKWRYWDESTRNWWLEQKEGVLIDIMQKAEPWHTVIHELCEWAWPAGHLTFWSKPTHFDFNFISSYCYDLNLEQPFHYRQANDLNTFLRGLYYPERVPNVDLPFTGDAHNALNDTLYQLKVLFHHLDAKDIIIQQQKVSLTTNVTDAVYEEVSRTANG